jgi:hypothetical protein
MLFGKRDKRKPNERVEDLKARVDALRQADEARRAQAYSLDHFLEGDDVLTGREVEDNYEPTGFTADEPASVEPDAPTDYEAALAAELEKYLRREEMRARLSQPPVEPKPPTESEPENTSLLLDGTWSRDGDRRRPSAADRAWHVTGSDWVSQPDDADEEVDESRPEGGFEDGWDDRPPRQRAV